MNKTIKIGITGQSGFVGTHLYNFLSTQENVECVPFEDQFFQDENELVAFVSKCDVIVHLAALNRHNDADVIFKTNVDLVRGLINAMEVAKVKPHVLFSSSTQEDRNNLYGKSKAEGRRMFIEWAEKTGATFTGLVIPNVFGPFGNPYYNSVVATFAHQLTHNEQPQIEIDADIQLIYVGELTRIIVEEIKKKRNNYDFRVPHTKKIKVSELLSKLTSYKIDYFERGIIPDLSDSFERNLFITFSCYINHKDYFPRKLELHTDNRGSFVEIAKLEGSGQTSFSTTVPGITRGNHYHTRKSERFAVIKGKARIDLRRIGSEEVFSFEIDADSQPAYVDMPIWHTHNITNIGDSELYTIFWISEQYDPEDSDTYFEKV